MKTPLILAVLVLTVACGGSDDEDGGGSSAPPVVCNAGTAVSIGPSAANPACVRAEPGATVTISNGRATALEVRSSPHPTHGSCPEIDETAPIPAGGSVAVVMRTLGTCRFHDHASGAALGAIHVGSGSPTAPGPGGY